MIPSTVTSHSATLNVPPKPSIPLAAQVSKKLLAPSAPRPQTTPQLVDALVARIVDYMLFSKDDLFETSGRAFLTERVRWHVDRNIQIQLALPAFPFKSPSKDKVLGTLPDMAEEIVLRRLEDLCRSLEDLYPPGAQLHIVSDGIVYGELLRVPETTVYQYNAALRSLVSSLALTHISFVRVRDLLQEGFNATTYSRHDIPEEEYVLSSRATREAFLATEIGSYDVQKQISNDEGALRTYRGYLKFLKADLSGVHLHCDKADCKKTLSKRGRECAISAIAKAMMRNGALFSAIVAKAFPDAVRLSIHPHQNAGPKFALKVFPNVDLVCTPWHNVVVENADGSITIAHRHTVDTSKCALIYRHGRPYHFREIDDDMDWGNSNISFEKLHPFGMKVIATEVDGKKWRWKDVPMAKVRRLTGKHSLLIFKGFEGVDKTDYTVKAREMGEIAPWVFGEVLEVKENPNFDLNNVLTSEAMPMHFDGIFKTKRLADGTVVPDPPTFQMFQCLEAPLSYTGAKDSPLDIGGRTLFANTANIFAESLSHSPYAADVKSRMWTIFTPPNKNYGGDEIKVPLLQKNPLTGHQVLSWHEPWRVYLISVTLHLALAAVNIIGVSPERSTEISNRVTELLYDRRYCYEHTWERGDFLIADNVELIHARTAFKPGKRELWRIHVN
ncbi:Pyoverdine/dityrosine biosynthesis protein-domain-containing protein [Cantharellus anzutake]|uniref:Pyoverdine/dityrosine biosynthesis protein-domain-containing protein n=1 Tax=Cantharellus anzutake TaxID=1750568 RepID=UPI0019074766|nr:Pyoverdine/dityrosine biosynthesis protein-domain-containing protein [Cantharellus anzutake]KAF8323622.1 Pyoverdine/dityrosine biosynthesis protein-domain-containing protein [Cantharellus anzutake]